MNEAFIVFADHADVLRALQDIRASNGSAEDVVALIKRMASAAGVRIPLDDAFINSPFKPTARHPDYVAPLDR